MKILVTGANGFVGKYLLSKIQSAFGATAQIASWDVLQQLSRVSSCSCDQVIWSNVDVTNAQKVAIAVQQFLPTHVIHLAAISHVPTSLKQPQKTWDVNVLGTLHLMEAVKKYCPQCLVVYVSSSEIYGSSFKGSQQGLTEDALLQPRNHYAASKAAADLMVGQYVEQGMVAIRLRPFNHVGPGQSEDFVVSSFAAQIARIEQHLQPPVVDVGNLDARRDFLDVTDVVAAYVQVLASVESLPRGLVLNIASGIPRRIGDILDELLQHSTEKIEIRSDPERMRAADIPVAFGVSARAKDCLNWEPRVLWKDTLVSILDYWRTKIRDRT